MSGGLLDPGPGALRARSGPGTLRARSEPGALRARAELLARARGFFAERGVLEVETPLLTRGVVVERHIDPPAVDLCGERFHLAASPEAAMKRLLARGAGPIYQITRAFRAGESGRWHEPEFTILEWYRPGFDDRELVSEVEALTTCLLAPRELRYSRSAYADLFREFAGIDPLVAGTGELVECCRERGYLRAREEVDRDTACDLVLSLLIQPELARRSPSGAGASDGALDALFVHSWPASQAALARLDERDPRVARRFELYVDGVEIANGYHELRDAHSQRERFEEANRQRAADGKPALPLDEDFLESLDALPDCAGVAVGFDRLVALASGASGLDEVLALRKGFPVAGVGPGREAPTLR